MAVRDGGSRSESSRPPCRNSRTIIQPRNPPPPPPPPLERQRMLRRTGEREGRRTGERKGRCTGEREGRRAEGTGGLASGGAGRPEHERTGRPAHERTGRTRGREGWRGRTGRPELSRTWWRPPSGTLVQNTQAHRRECGSVVSAARFDGRRRRRSSPRKRLHSRRRRRRSDRLDGVRLQNAAIGIQIMKRSLVGMSKDRAGDEKMIWCSLGSQ